MLSQDPCTARSHLVKWSRRTRLLGQVIGSNPVLPYQKIFHHGARLKRRVYPAEVGGSNMSAGHDSTPDTPHLLNHAADDGRAFGSLQVAMRHFNVVTASTLPVRKSHAHAPPLRPCQRWMCECSARFPPAHASWPVQCCWRTSVSPVRFFDPTTSSCPAQPRNPRNGPFVSLAAKAEVMMEGLQSPSFCDSFETPPTRQNRRSHTALRRGIYFASQPLRGSP